MHFPSVTLGVISVLAALTEARFLIYADEWHPTRPTNPEDRAGIDHVVLAFAFANATASFQPKVPISTIRLEYPNAKVMIAVGGWGDDIGYFEASKTDATIQKFASDIATMLTNTGADGVDIDWEYPGGNGADYKQVPNSQKVYQIDAYPKTLAAVRTAIGSKLLSIAVPGKKGDMIAFTADNGPKIWPSVDYINVMSYDMMNRRDNVTRHHTSVAGSEDTIRNYLNIGAPPEKINLGFAYYAKYFATQGDCSTQPLGCPIVPAENPVTGKDTLTSGAWTFEKFHLSPVDISSLRVSYDGTCGPEKGTKCGSGCCSQYGNCGTSPEHCSGACQHAFGSGCTDADVAGSWQLAAANGVTDEREGGQYYFDPQNRLFWTWDTPELITRKFDDIVSKYNLGGVMAWSLGEDSYDWSHVRQMAGELAKREAKGGDVKSAHWSQPLQPATEPDSAPVTPTDHDPSLPSTSAPYNVVWVDGTQQGPVAEPSTEPGSPPDFSVNYQGPGEDTNDNDDNDDDDDDTPAVSLPSMWEPSSIFTPTPPAILVNPYVPPAEPNATPTPPLILVNPYRPPVDPYAPPPPPVEPLTPVAPVAPFTPPVEPLAPLVPVAPIAPIAPIVPTEPFASAPSPRPLLLPLKPFFNPDFVPDPGYINPNWKSSGVQPAADVPSVAALPATVLPATVLPATVLPATVLPATVLPAAALPVVASPVASGGAAPVRQEEEESSGVKDEAAPVSKEAAALAEPVEAGWTREGKGRACRMKRRRAV